MRLLTLLIGCLSASPLMLGCTTCASLFDTHYAAQGGTVDRIDREQGRVNSAFSAPSVPIPQQAAPPTEPAESSVEPVPTPVPPETQQEREAAYYDF